MNDDVTITHASACPRCNLYAYRIPENRFDELALAVYFASGKFDKTTIHRWTAGRLLTNPHKAQNFRASVDNTVVLLPVDKLVESDTMCGHVFVVCYSETETNKTVVVAIGVATDDPFELVDSPYAKYVLPVHVLTTMCGASNDFDDACGKSSEMIWTSHPSLPSEIFLLVDDLADAISETIDDEEPECEYARQKRVARGFCELVERAKTLKTPSPLLENERLDRLGILMTHLETAKSQTAFPATRRKVGKKNVQGLAGVLKTYEKHAAMFGKLFPSL
jgi:hypothetical protein